LHEKGYKESYCLDFPDMNHGFVTRGDMKDQDVSKRVIEALEEAVKFFKRMF